MTEFSVIFGVQISRSLPRVLCRVSLSACAMAELAANAPSSSSLPPAHDDKPSKSDPLAAAFGAEADDDALAAVDWEKASDKWESIGSDEARLALELRMRERLAFLDAYAEIGGPPEEGGADAKGGGGGGKKGGGKGAAAGGKADGKGGADAGKDAAKEAKDAKEAAAAAEAAAQEQIRALLAQQVGDAAARSRAASLRRSDASCPARARAARRATPAEGCGSPPSTSTQTRALSPPRLGPRARRPRCARARARARALRRTPK